MEESVDAPLLCLAEIYGVTSDTANRKASLMPPDHTITPPQFREERRMHAKSCGLASRILLGLITLALSAVGPATAQDMPETSVEAIRAYADGAEAYLAEDYDEALEHLRRAHELDRTFITPVFMQYIIAGNMGDTPLRDSLEVVLQANRYRMSEYYQGMLDAIVLRRRAMFSASAEVLHDVVERYPGTKAAYNYANYDWTANPRKALRALEQLDPDREPIRGWYSYWSVRHNALHTLGDLEGALENARQAQRRHPDRLGPVHWEALMHGALGNVQAAEESIERALAFPSAVAGLGFRDVGHAMMAHGFEREGRALLERALAWFDTEDTRTTNAAASQRAYTLYLLGRYSESRDAYRALAEAAPDNDTYQVSLGVTSALAGDRAAAEAVLARVQRDEIGANFSTRNGWEVLLYAALGDVESTKRAVATFGIRPLWLHRDPVLQRLLGEDADFQRFLATGS